MKLHSTLFGWSYPDQALRVAAGILAHVGLVWNGEEGLWNRFNWELQ
jgi:hypothetical protein